MHSYLLLDSTELTLGIVIIVVHIRYISIITTIRMYVSVVGILQINVGGIGLGSMSR